MLITMLERFWLRVDRRGSDECWPWTGAQSKAGYGMLGLPRNMRRGTKSVQATHIALGIAGVRRPSVHAMALHSCDNPCCVNPAHLRWGDHADNAEDAVDRRRYKVGAKRAAARAEMDRRAADISLAFGKSEIPNNSDPDP